jgi:hypothetical protein
MTSFADGETPSLNSAFLTVLYISSIKITPGGASSRYDEGGYSLASSDWSKEQESPMFSHYAMNAYFRYLYCFRVATTSYLTERPS